MNPRKVTLYSVRSRRIVCPRQRKGVKERNETTGGSPRVTLVHNGRNRFFLQRARFFFSHSFFGLYVFLNTSNTILSSSKHRNPSCNWSSQNIYLKIIIKPLFKLATECDSNPALSLKVAALNWSRDSRLLSHCEMFVWLSQSRDGFG